MESNDVSWAGPYELQLAKNWTTEEAQAADNAQVWAPAVGHPLQYASIVDIFGSSCSLQPYVVPASSYSSDGEQQLVEYNYYAAAVQHQDDPDPMQIYLRNPKKLFLERIKELKDDAKLMERKMHRCPPSIHALGDWCTVPKVVAIGPYYHGRDQLEEAEKMKYVAAWYCIREYISVNNNSSHPLQDLYDAVVSAVVKSDAGSLYDKDVMAGINCERDFLPMMFYDACFLVMYILKMSRTPLHPDLYNFFKSNDDDIANDIMLLENQIPLQVLDAVVRKCTAQPLEKLKTFISRWREEGFLQDRAVREFPSVDWDESYYYNKAPHLLGLVRFYAVGKRSRKFKLSSSESEKMESIQLSGSAIELAEMGIFLTGNETTELSDIGLDNKWIIFAKLSMPPLFFNDTRASFLVNMAALELCTTPDFFGENVRSADSAVCSYLRLLGMLMHREEDVHELRTKGVLQGGGLTNKKTLDFFTSLQSLRKGRCYGRVMVQIQNYRNKKRWIKVYAFLYNNWKFIAGFFSALGIFIGIITALMRLKGGH